MLKKTSLLIVVLGTQLAMSGHKQELKTLEPAATVIAFDLHGVVLKPSPKKIFSVLKEFPNKILMAKLLLSPVFWYNVMCIRRQTEVAEDVFYRLAHVYPELKNHEKEFMQLVNAQYVDPTMLEFIKMLKTKGFKLYICSNIGSRTYKNLQEQLPDLVALFDGAFTSTHENNYIQKPQQEYYDKFKQYIAHEQPHITTILLLDDKQKNIAGAQKAGMQALLVKTIQQVIKDILQLVA